MDPNTRLDQISFAPTDAFKDVLAGMTRYSSKIALIVDSNCRLIGIVTDGDIRRALALGIELTDTIEKVMNRKPITASPKESRRALMGVMRRTDLTYIPVVDEDRRVIRVESLAHLTLSLSHHDGRRALLMAGGFGTRLRPLTDSVPKPLIKLGSKPIIEVIIDDLRSAGFSEIMISTHYRAEMIESHLGDGGDLGVEIAYIREDIPLGTAGALRLLPSGWQDGQLLVLNSDILASLDYDELWTHHHAADAFATICAREIEIEIPYGVIDYENNFLRQEIREKPRTLYAVNAGIYVVDGRITSAMKQDEAWTMPDLLNLFHNRGEKISVFKIDNEWIDIGTIEGLNIARKIFGERPEC